MQAGSAFEGHCHYIALPVSRGCAALLFYVHGNLLHQLLSMLACLMHQLTLIIPLLYECLQVIACCLHLQSLAQHLLDHLL